MITVQGVKYFNAFSIRKPQKSFSENIII